MDINTILAILQVILYVLLGGLAFYFNQNAKLQKKATELINTAEGMYIDTTKAGGKRFEWVVDSLYSLVPAVLKSFIPRSWIEVLVQTVFDEMKDFAQKNLDEAVKKICNDETPEGE